jgi:2',3'-cyclic-nucleotide 2'-phosphodiesterase (5'-nucleotidase family)
MTHHFSLGALSRRALHLTLAMGVALGCSRAMRPGEAATNRTGTETSGGAQTELVIAATTDTHGRLRSWDYYANNPEPQRGLTRIATPIARARCSARRHSAPGEK